MASRVVGLDIGTSVVRAAEVEFGSGGPSSSATPTLLKFAQVGLPLGAVRDGEVEDSGVVAGAIRQLWSQGGFDTREVVIGVGNQRVIVRDIELPAMPPAQLRGSLAFHVQDSLPVSANDALLDFYPTSQADGPQGRTIHGLLVAAQRETVSANVIAAEAAGLKPQMVDLNGFALVRSLARGELAQRSIAIVDIGARVTTVVVAVAGVPRLVRLLASGGQNVSDAVAAAMSCPPAEAEVIKREVGFGFATQPHREPAREAIESVGRALVDSVRNTIGYYQASPGAVPIEGLVLTGGGAHLPGLGQFLASACRLGATLGDPLAGFRYGRGFDQSSIAGGSSMLAVSVGLAFGVAA